MGPLRVRWSLRQAALVCSLCVWTGCATTQHLSYDVKSIPQASGPPINASVNVSPFTDKRHDHAPSAILFKEDNNARIDGEVTCINSEQHYDSGNVSKELTALITQHLRQRGVIRQRDTTAPSYVLEGSLLALYGRQGHSDLAQAGVGMGLLGALATSGETTKGSIEIVFTDLVLRNTRDGTTKQLPDTRIHYEGDLPEHGYCWDIYAHVNEQLRRAVDVLSLAVEAALRSSDQEHRPPAVVPVEQPPMKAVPPQESRQQVEFLHWQAAHRAWLRQTEPTRNQRRPLMQGGFFLSGIGIGLLTAGVLLETQAIVKNNQAHNQATAWRNATTLDEQQALSKRVKESQSSRDTLHALGLTGLIGGGVALGTAALLFSMMDPVAEEPMPPTHPTLRVSTEADSTGGMITLSGAM